MKKILLAAALCLGMAVAGPAFAGGYGNYYNNNANYTATGTMTNGATLSGNNVSQFTQFGANTVITTGTYCPQTVATVDVNGGGAINLSHNGAGMFNNATSYNINANNHGLTIGTSTDSLAAAQNGSSIAGVSLNAWARN